MQASPFAAALLCCALATPARAQMDSREGIMLQNQILELRHDMQLMQQQRGAPQPYYGDQSSGPPRSGGANGGASGLEAQLLDRVQTLEDEVRSLRGRLDEQTNALHRAQDDLAKQIGDLNFRLGNAAGGVPGGTSTGASAPTRPTGPSATIDSRSAPPSAPPQPPPRTPEIALQQGNAALARRDYQAAESAAREVLATGRNSPRAADANFLLAQSLLGQRNYQGAAVAYDDAYNRSRNGARAPDALLGLANALTGMNEHPAACTTIEKLRREFPNIRGAVRETAVALRARNGCS